MDDVLLIFCEFILDALGLHNALGVEFRWARRSQNSELREGVLEPADVGSLEVALVRLAAGAVHDVLIESKSLTPGVVSLTGSSAPEISTKGSPLDAHLVSIEGHLGSFKTNWLRLRNPEDVVA